LSLTHDPVGHQNCAAELSVVTWKEKVKNPKSFYIKKLDDRRCRRFM